MTVHMAVEHEAVIYPATVATIAGTRLGVNDHGVFTADLTLDLLPTGGVHALGGWVLDDVPSERGGGRMPLAVGMEFVVEIMRVVGVSTWEDLVGQKILALSHQDGDGGWGSTNVGIASLSGIDVLVPEAWFAARKEVSA